jgi:hypothetical protein
MVFRSIVLNVKFVNFKIGPIFTFQNISLSMPKTAYLKLIDIWLIFCLVVPFVTFIIQIYWELQRAKRDKTGRMLMALLRTPYRLVI